MNLISRWKVWILLPGVLLGGRSYGSEAPNPKPLRFQPDPAVQAQIDRIVSIATDEEKSDEIIIEKVILELDRLLAMTNHDSAKILTQSDYYVRTINNSDKAMAYPIIPGLLNYPYAVKEKTYRPYLGSEDSDTKLMLKAKGGSLREPDAEGKRAQDRWVEETLLPVYISGLSAFRDSPPMNIVEHIYRYFPDIALKIMAEVYAKGAESKKLLEAQKTAKKASSRSKRKKILAELSEHKEWWVRLYAAAVLNESPELQDPNVINRLKEDEHPLVRRAMLNWEKDKPKQ